MYKGLISILFFIITFTIFTQGQTSQNATITGKITDAVTNAPVELVTVYIRDTNLVAESSSNGRYSLEIPSNQELILVFSRIGYKETQTRLRPMPSGSRRQIDVALAPADSDLEVIVRESKIEEGGMIKEEVESLKLLPTASGNLESILPHIALGTSSGVGGELSSQYTVRGGNYDENLVYVNDFEIYRPQLIRTAQQEGLSFPNIDLIRDLTFSSGGFEARYGDKLSSVLDIKYKRPDSLRGSFSISMLGATAHLEGSARVANNDYQKFRYLIGARYKNNRYLLGTLDNKGEYNPNHSDIQAYLTYDLSRDWQLGFLGNYNRSQYRFAPTERSTALGLINFALQLFTVSEGEELNDLTTAMGGLSLTYIPSGVKNPFYLKFMASAQGSDENESTDIIGNYSLRQIESGLGSNDFGDVLAELGTGTQHEFIRNRLDTRITNLEHRGGWEIPRNDPSGNITSSHFLQWSVKYQQEDIEDNIKEWERLDSAGYSLPFSDTEVLLFDVLKTQNSISSNRYSAFLQNTFTYRKEDAAEWRISAGLRASYWDLNEELLISPRAEIMLKPLASRADISFRLAGGLYYQPPFYRELRRFDGTINTDLKAQKSAHIVGGLTWDFYIGKSNPKKFRLITEAYYKQLWDLVYYDFENVRIRYSGENNATGYITGLDLRLNGEFVPGAESWINLSILRAREKLEGVTHLRREVGQEEAQEVSDVPRPTDRAMNLSIFFQDYLPKNENFKMHLNLSIGTGLPFGLRDNNEIFRNTYRLSAYHRVDIGFSLALWDQSRRAQRPSHFLSFTRSTWLSLEVFNLMQVQNQADNTWIKTVFSQQYAIPNYLTSRRINLRMRMEF